MKQCSTLFIATLCLSACAQVPFEDNELNLAPASFRIAQPGTELIWRNTDDASENAIRVAEPDGYAVRYVNAAGDQSADHLMCWYCAGTEFDESGYAELWPLRVGKSIEIVRRDPESTRSWINRIEVIGTERISLPIGMVDAYVVRNESWAQGAGPGRWYGNAYYWFAPAVGWVVKTQASDSMGSENRYEVVVVRVTE